MKRVTATLAIAAMALFAAGMAAAPDAAVAQAGGPVGAPGLRGDLCPITGCKLPGLVVPNNLSNCQNGANVHEPLKFDPKAILCNTGPIDPATWVYGPQNDLTAEEKAAPFYNQVKARMAQGLPVTGTRWSAPDGADYCTVAKYDDAKNHFTWADQFHAALDNSVLYAKWQSYCPGMDYVTTAARGSAGGWPDEREAQRDTDGGAIVFIRPMKSVREAQENIFWYYWPPFGHRSSGGSNVYNDIIMATKNGSYRKSFNNNLVMIAQINTVAGARVAGDIAAMEGIHALYLDEDALRLHSTGVADYDLLATGIRAAAKNNKKYLCTVDRRATPATMTCNP
jgi:2-keto-3-deoxy-L-rhamnonate aldolase RhmA